MRAHLSGYPSGHPFIPLALQQMVEGKLNYLGPFKYQTLLGCPKFEADGHKAYELLFPWDLGYDESEFLEVSPAVKATRPPEKKSKAKHPTRI